MIYFSISTNISAVSFEYSDKKGNISSKYPIPLGNGVTLPDVEVVLVFLSYPSIIGFACANCPTVVPPVVPGVFTGVGI